MNQKPHTAGERWDVGRGTPTKWVFDTQREMTVLYEEVISSGFTASLLKSKKPHDWLMQRTSLAKLGAHTVLCVWLLEV